MPRGNLIPAQKMIVKYESQIAGLEMIRDLIDSQINKYKKELEEIYSVENYNIHIKNNTETIIHIDFPDGSSVAIKDYIPKSSLTKQQLLSFELKSLYDEGNIVDVSSDSMVKEKTLSKIHSPGRRPPEPIKHVADVGVEMGPSEGPDIAVPIDISGVKDLSSETPNVSGFMKNVKDLEALKELSQVVESSSKSPVKKKRTPAKKAPAKKRTKPKKTTAKKVAVKRRTRKK